MEIDIDPVYIKDEDINIVRGNTLIKLCNTINKLFPGEIYGAQKVNNIWLLYPRTNRIRAALIVSGFCFESKQINVYDDNPLKFDRQKSERLVIKDLPATIPPHMVTAFLKGYPQLKLRSKVIYARERFGGEEMSPFINGDRHVYITPGVSPPLPKETVICGHNCRIWHPSQKNYCKRCASHGHRTNDIDLCESYEADCTVAAFRADSNPLSNFYMCTLTHDGLSHKSAEHFYQREFCLFANRGDVAQLVYEAPSPRRAKELATQLKSEIGNECMHGQVDHN